MSDESDDYTTDASAFAAKRKLVDADYGDSENDDAQNTDEDADEFSGRQQQSSYSTASKKKRVDYQHGAENTDEDADDGADDGADLDNDREKQAKGGVMMMMMHEEEEKASGDEEKDDEESFEISSSEDEHDEDDDDDDFDVFEGLKSTGTSTNAKAVSSSLNEAAAMLENSLATKMLDKIPEDNEVECEEDKEGENATMSQAIGGNRAEASTSAANLANAQEQEKRRKKSSLDSPAREVARRKKIEQMEEESKKMQYLNLRRKY
jgi:hypothetical protein